jgi:hypothetical protein
MLPIPKADKVAGYRKTLMEHYVVKATIDPLRDFMYLPDKVAESKVILMMYIESNPHLKCANPSKVMDNLKSMAITYFQTAGTHLDLRMAMPPQMLLLSGDTSSIRSRASVYSQQVSEQGSDEELSEAQLAEEERKLAELEARKDLQRSLRQRKRELELREKKLLEEIDEPVKPKKKGKKDDASDSE